MKKAMSIIVAVIMLICGFSLPSNAVDSQNFSYEVVNDEIVITKYIGTNQTSVTVPASINNIPVVAIGEGAFKDNTVITTVKVSEGVRDIGESAFENCTSLATITLPTTITHIGEKAIYNTSYYNNEKNWKKQQNQTSSGGIGFGGGLGHVQWEDIAASGLTYLYLGTNLIEISYSGSYTLKIGTRVIADSAFAECEANTVTLSESLVSIGNNAFNNCQKLTTVKFNDNIEFIGDSAFEGCISLEEINLPDKYIEMSSNSFYNTGFYNNSNNWDNDILCSGKMLIDIRGTHDLVEIKDGIKYITGDSLGENNVYIPRTVTHISQKAFSGSSKSTIFGYANTYAQEYANAYSINFVAIDNLGKGDVNTDGKVDSVDYRILCGIATTQKIPNLVERLVGDMDEDGVIDGFDVIILDLMINDMPPSQLKGDVNGDNKVNDEDYDLLVKIVSTKERITDNFMFKRADVNEDGAVDGFDVIHLDLALNGIVALI
mgnify:FL=1